MKTAEKIVIDVFNLKLGKSELNFELSDVFTEQFENDLFTSCKCSLNILIDKSNTMLQTQTHLKGTLGLVCDRSLDHFDYQFEDTSNIVFKFGQAYEELTEELFVIPSGEKELDITQIIYDIICTNVPMKKLHPRFKDDDDTEDEIRVVFKSDENTSEIDPRWEALKNLSKN
jgi:uncharacterized metal-binding protein YceD (DUF177 family)